MDITLSPQTVTWRTTGGILDFFVFLGPNPDHVTQQYTAVVGRPAMIPYWSLGFQLNKNGYGTLSEMKKVVNGIRNYDIPFDVQYADIDYMDRRLGFTIDPINYDGLSEFVEQMHNEWNMRFIIVLNPAISIEEPPHEPPAHYPPHVQGDNYDVWIRRNNGELETGKAWPFLPNSTTPATVGFPDFFKSQTRIWWSTLIIYFYHLELNFDGLRIDMNEPSSFTQLYDEECDTENLFNRPKFVPNIKSRNHITDKTICLDGKQHYRNNMTDRYNVHSLYGYSQSEHTIEACRLATGKRCLVISRSTFPGSSKYVQHWLGDNESIWRHLKQSVIGMMEYSLFGFSYTGADICGHIGNATYEMCLRWHMLGAFYPLSRNNNGPDNVVSLRFLIALLVIEN